MMIKLLTALLLYTSQNAYANRAVMEALPTTFNAVTIGTTTPQLLINTTFYSGVIPTVSVKAASNVVVGADACVIYSTGSMGCSGAITGDGTHLSNVIYFISSNTVSGSTATVSTVLTVFSTYNYVANTISSAGDKILIECAFTNPGPVTTAQQSVYVDSTELARMSDGLSNHVLMMSTRLLLARTGKALYVSDGIDSGTGSGAYEAVTVGIGPYEQVFDETSSHVFNCKASRASGATINFAWMRVTRI